MLRAHVCTQFYGTIDSAITRVHLSGIWTKYKYVYCIAVIIHLIDLTHHSTWLIHTWCKYRTILHDVSYMLYRTILHDFILHVISHYITRSYSTCNIALYYTMYPTCYIALYYTILSYMLYRTILHDFILHVISHYITRFYPTCYIALHYTILFYM